MTGGCFLDSTAFWPRRSSKGFLCSNTAMPMAGTSTFVHRASIVSPPSTISTRPRLRGSRRMASTHVLLSRPAPATFKLGSSIRERFRNSSEPSPRRHWPSGTTLTPARRTGGGLDALPASPIANPNTESLTASFLSCACTATVDNSKALRQIALKDLRHIAIQATRLKLGRPSVSSATSSPSRIVPVGSSLKAFAI